MGRLLVVEDDRDLRLLLRYVLVRAGHDVSTVADGATALHASAVDRFDLVLLDNLMPGMDGVEVLEALSRRRRECRPRTLVLSGLVEPEDVRRYFDLGALGVVAKPFAQADLLDRVAAALASPLPLTDDDRADEQQDADAPARPVLLDLPRARPFATADVAHLVRSA
ncbi:response regulator [Nocardioides sp. GY 10127]|uniref:response regulator n=1 Tax=Nocardioides sp. GY 10127 TaxID=2569762 RepID=UPI0010A8F642|nr:response regulator [Nocardioides sp. GY 10127]TIC81784.1 response regulator [Nocardioides sp. GY 10127]